MASVIRDCSRLLNENTIFPDLKDENGKRRSSRLSRSYSQSLHIQRDSSVETKEVIKDECEEEIKIEHESPRYSYSYSDGNDSWISHFNIEPDILAKVPEFNPIGLRKRLQSTIEMIILEAEMDADDDVGVSMDDLDNFNESHPLFWSPFSDQVKEKAEALVKNKSPMDTFAEDPIERCIELRELVIPKIKVEVEEEDDVEILEVINKTSAPNVFTKDEREFDPRTVNKKYDQSPLKIVSPPSLRSRVQSLDFQTEDESEECDFHGGEDSEWETDEKESLDMGPEDNQTSCMEVNDSTSEETLLCANELDFDAKIYEDQSNVHQSRSWVGGVSGANTECTIKANLWVPLKPTYSELEKLSCGVMQFDDHRAKRHIAQHKSRSLFNCVLRMEEIKPKLEFTLTAFRP